jgi:hypothetical protein
MRIAKIMPFILQALFPENKEKNSLIPRVMSKSDFGNAGG